MFHLLLKAVCAGPSSCKYTDTAKCVITPISSRNTCRSPLSVTTYNSVVDMSRFIYLLRHPLSVAMCNTDDPRNCKKLEGIFAYMKTRSVQSCYLSAKQTWKS